MTIDSQVRTAGPYAGDGVSRVFPFAFKVFVETDILVARTDSAGLQTDIVLGTDYAVVLNADQNVAPGGSVTLVSALAVGYSLTITSDVAVLQPVDLTNQGGFYPQVIEDALDRLTILLQQQGFVGLRQTLRVPEVGGVQLLPPAADRALRLIGFDSTGNVLMSVPSSGDASGLALDLLNSASASKGSGMMAFGPSLAYAALTVGRKLQQVVHVEDHGAVGDGTTNDSAALTAALARALSLGRTLVFDGTKTYAVNTGTFAIPAGTRAITNGCTFTTAMTSTSNAAFFDIGANVTIDKLYLSLPAGIRRDRCIRALGDDVNIGDLKVTSVDVQVTAEADDAALTVGNGKRVRFGSIDVTNYDRAAIVFGTTDSQIGLVRVTGYVRGLYAYDNVGLKVHELHTVASSQNATNSPGHNGLILQSTSDGAQRDCWFGQVIVEDAGEHAIRIGGDFQHQGIRIESWAAKRCGNCGVKILGTDTNTPTSRNKDIWIGPGLVEDCGLSVSAATNRVGVLAQFVDNMHIGPVTMRAKDATWSVAYGILIDACTNVVIQPAIITAVQFDAVLIFADNGDNERIQVNGGVAYACGRDALRITTSATRASRRIDVDGLFADGNTGLAFNVNNSGSMVECHVRMKLYGNAAGSGACNAGAVTLDITGVPGSVTPISGITANDGSTWATGTTLQLRKGGAWVAL